MDTVLRLLFYEMLGLGLIATVVKSFTWRDYLKKPRKAAQGKLLRSAGDSFQRETQILNDWLMGLLAGIVATPAILLGQMPHTIDGRSMAIMAVAIVAWAVPLIYLLGFRRNLQLGLRAKRAMAEELSLLMRDGCYVFHDYPTGPSQSIDHVIVAPSGIYAIETNGRRKKGFSGNKNAELSFNGTQIGFSGGHGESELVELARRNAVELSRELTAAGAENITVNPILTFPGWNIIRTGKGDVNVLTAEEIRATVTAADKPALSPAQIQRLASQIEQKCRDIEL
jgi:hypothetical protein